MNKREIKTATNQELLERLMGTCFITRVTKPIDAEAKSICKELEERGTIQNAADLYKIWRG